MYVKVLTYKNMFAMTGRPQTLVKMSPAELSGLGVTTNERKHALTTDLMGDYFKAGLVKHIICAIFHGSLFYHDKLVVQTNISWRLFLL